MILSAHAPQVVDRPVIALPEATATPSCVQETVFFTPAREVRRCTSGDLVGQLDDYAGEILWKIQADDQLILQLTLSASPLAVELDMKPPRGTVGFLGIIIYGPKRRSSDVAYFMTQCGYYLDDPTGCDRNVPYMNPQCLFSFHEELPMTFDLPQVQQQSVDDSTQTPFDILAGFETTDRLPEANTPSALCTTLQVYVRRILRYNLLT